MEECLAPFSVELSISLIIVLIWQVFHLPNLAGNFHNAMCQFRQQTYTKDRLLLKCEQCFSTSQKLKSCWTVLKENKKLRSTVDIQLLVEKLSIETYHEKHQELLFVK